MKNLNDFQRRTSQAIVNVFETGKPKGDYGAVTVLKGDSGHLTYGRSQATLKSGNLYLLIKAYCDNPDARYSSSLIEYLERLKSRDISLDNDSELHRILRLAGNDKVMHETQDSFFDERFWRPAVKSAASMGISTALGVCVIYDSRIHGSWIMIRNRTTERHGNPDSIGEKTWIIAYLNERDNWLANHNNRLLRNTTYRVRALRQLAEDGNWNLDLPLRVRGVVIDKMLFL